MCAAQSSPPASPAVPHLTPVAMPGPVGLPVGMRSQLGTHLELLLQLQDFLLRMISGSLAFGTFMCAPLIHHCLCRQESSCRHPSPEQRGKARALGRHLLAPTPASLLLPGLLPQLFQRLLHGRHALGRLRQSSKASTAERTALGLGPFRRPFRPLSPASAAAASSSRHRASAASWRARACRSASCAGKRIG